MGTAYDGDRTGIYCAAIFLAAAVILSSGTSTTCPADLPALEYEPGQTAWSTQVGLDGHSCQGPPVTVCVLRWRLSKMLLTSLGPRYGYGPRAENDAALTTAPLAAPGLER